MNNKKSLNKLLDFIQNTEYDKLSQHIQQQAIKCFFDLASVVCAGAKNNTSKKMASYVEANYPSGGATILSSGKKVNLLGAALANGMSANALDMDDGYSLLRGHPGSGFLGALLSAAEITDCTYGEFLSALVVAYETGIRDGYAIRDYYKWDHSSGSYSTFATAASVGKLMGLSREDLYNALSIADFLTPVIPAKRSCYAPSMNKDGIYFGQHVGVQAVMMAKSGITGKSPVILDDEYQNLIASLGEKYYMFDLYIKFFSCCRWAHSPICALDDLMKSNTVSISDIKHIDVFSFGRAGTLYKCAPTCEDEAQYNINYPIAAKLIFGDCGPLESSTKKMLDERIAPIIEKIDFHHDTEYDKVFPAQRLSRVKITLKNDDVLESDAFEPRGDHNANVSLDDLVGKAYKINSLYAPKKDIDEFVDAILNTPSNEPFHTVYGNIKKLASTNIHPNIKFI